MKAFTETQNPISIGSASARDGDGAGASAVELPRVVLRSGETTTPSEEIVRPARSAASSAASSTASSTASGTANGTANGTKDSAAVRNQFVRRAASAIVVLLDFFLSAIIT